MNRKYLPMIALPLLSSAAVATDYTVDFSRVDNLESIRPLVKGCADFDAMELYRSKMESIANLEDMRPTLSAMTSWPSSAPILSNRDFDSNAGKFRCGEMPVICCPNFLTDSKSIIFLSIGILYF